MKNFRRFLLPTLLIIISLLLPSCENAPPPQIDKIFAAVAQSCGGKVAAYDGSSDIPIILTALYGRAGSPPDEISLVKYARLWYSERFDGGDAALFYVTNATDAQSLAKMCERRARTLKYAAGLDSEIIISGHYVVFLNCPGALSEAADEIRSLIKAQPD